MTVDEELEILSYYLKPGLHSDRFSEDTIQTLKDAGYLGCGITIELEETLRTMDMGRVYMRSYGMAVPEDESGNRSWSRESRPPGQRAAHKHMIIRKLLGIQRSGGTA